MCVCSKIIDELTVYLGLNAFWIGDKNLIVFGNRAFADKKRRDKGWLYIKDMDNQDILYVTGEPKEKNVLVIKLNPECVYSGGLYFIYSNLKMALSKLRQTGWLVVNLYTYSRKKGKPDCVARSQEIWHEMRRVTVFNICKTVIVR